jgi:tricorn protease
MRLLPLIALIPALAAAEPTRLLRQPDFHGDTVVFVYAGDLYTVSAQGGVAQRLTSHEGMELYPKFSPDGRWIAFSAEYSGTRQVWVIPAAGGTPRQLTFYNDVGPMPPRGGTDYRVLDWTPDGEYVLVRANRTPYGEREGLPLLVPFRGGMEKPLGPPETGGGSLSPDGRYFAFTPIDRDFRTWKRHRGGRAQDVWIYDLLAQDSRRLTDFIGTDHQPVWVGERIVFASDRKWTLNLFSMNKDGGDLRQETFFDEYDVLWPSSDGRRVVFENGGYIWLYDPAEGTPRRLDIEVRGDRPHTLPKRKNVAAFVESFDLSPNGQRAVFAARGELFTVPAKHGETRNLSRSPAYRERGVAWSPDGRWIAYLSDETGEYELYLRPQDDKGTARQLTRGSRTWYFPPVFSPDGRRIALAASDNRLLVVEVESGRITEVDQVRHANDFYRDPVQYTFSPDGRFLVYTKVNATRTSSLWAYDLQGNRRIQLTEDGYNDSSPAFDPKGRWLYFVSTRDHNLVFSSYEFNYLYANSSRIFAAALHPDQSPPIVLKSDEAVEPEGGGKGKREEGAGSMRFEPEGFAQRIVALKVPPGNYFGLAANEQGLFFLSAAGNQGQNADLRFYDLAKESVENVLSGVSSYRLSAKGDKLIWRQGERFGIAEAKPGIDLNQTALDLSRMELLIDPRIEWPALYRDAWRILRDWFYDPGMHGQDWEKIYERYRPLVDHVAHRADLDYVFGEIAGELNAGHVYVAESPDTPKAERKPGGLLGAEIEAHPSGYFRIAKIFPGENWHEYYRSPLTEPGVKARPGDFILAVDGVSTKSVKNFYELMQDKGERTVLLTLNDKPSEEGAWEARVRTITSEVNLRYLDWVLANRRKVHALSGGRIGYIHLPNTAIEGNRELIKGMLAEMHREALILDDRYNGGGFIPDRMIEILARRPLNYWVWRGFEPVPRPVLAHDGPKAMLINGLSSSGGDALPYYFRKLGLGPLIGTRTWGGLIGISGHPTLADGGAIIPATFRFLDTEGRWAVENEGVSPDIEVIDAPHLKAQGRDPSLEKAVEVLLAELAKKPPRRIQAPPAPRDFGFE